MRTGLVGLEPVPVYPARALAVEPDGTLYLSRHLEILRSRDDGHSWVRCCEIPASLWQHGLQTSRLACRLGRHEIRALAVLPDGTLVAATRRGLFRAGPGDSTMRAVEIERVAPAPWMPMTLAVDGLGRVLWGEYNSRNRHGAPIRVFVSDDGGRSFAVAWTFPPGAIRHVHSLQADRTEPGYWVFTGDRNEESGIGWLTGDLRRLEWRARGAQVFRAVSAFDLGDALLYGTDSGSEPNAVIRLEKSSGRWARLAELDSCCIYACRSAGCYVLSTSVTAAPLHRGGTAGLWISRDGAHWKRLFGGVKDRWSPRYFQYGSFVLPRGSSERAALLCSGQALSGLDGRAYRVTGGGVDRRCGTSR